MPRAASKFTIGLIYFAAVVQGLALVTFPAAGTIFTSDSGFGLSAARYGEMFIPQVVLAIAASSLGPWLAGRLGLRGVLLLGLAGEGSRPTSDPSSGSATSSLSFFYRPRIRASSFGA